jgi:hypothetical protein
LSTTSDAKPSARRCKPVRRRKENGLWEVLRARRRPPAGPLVEYAALYVDRDAAIAVAYGSGG